MKTFTKLALSLSLCVFAAGLAMADGSAFTPLNFDDTVYNGSGSNAQTTTINGSAAEAAGNESMQSAILKLDNAQVEVRNELLNCKTQYADIDAQYVSYKAQRKAMKSQIRSIERRISQIDKAKEKIRKNMLQKKARETGLFN